MKKDKVEEKALEAEQLFIKGDIFSPSISELTEYIQALLCYNKGTEYQQEKRKSYANTLKDLIAIKTTKELHNRTSLLTWIVITVASINAIIGGIHIWLLCNKSIHEEKIYNQQAAINQMIIEKLDDLSVTE